MVSEKLLTIIIVQYKTPELTRLCLRLLNLHTDLQKIKIVVVDNRSEDESLEYLRRLSWVTLVERPGVPGEGGPAAHARALDLGLEYADTPFVMVMHTDTFVTSDDWLDYLLAPFQNRKVAGVGSWKLERQSLLKRGGKWLEDFFKHRILAPLTGGRVGAKKARFADHYYLRSHCAVYRTALVKQHTQGFCGGDTAGKTTHQNLVKAGYEMIFLPADELIRYVCHLNHATMILHPELGGRKTGTPAARRRLAAEMNRLHYREILADATLDAPRS